MLLQFKFKKGLEVAFRTEHLIKVDLSDRTLWLHFINEKPLSYFFATDADAKLAYDEICTAMEEEYKI